MDPIRYTNQPSPSQRPAAEMPQPPVDSVIMGATPALPVRKAVLHVPLGGGEFLQVRKYPTRISDRVTPAGGGAIFVEANEGRTFLTRANDEGDVQYRLPIDETLQHVYASKDTGRVYLSGKRSVVGVNAESGQVTGELQFGTDGYSRVVLPQEDGRVVVLDGKEIIWLDRDGKETSREEAPWDCKGLQPLPGGGRILYGPNDFFHLGQIQITNAAGNEVFTSEQVRPSSVNVLPDGRIELLEYREKFDSELVRLDPESGESRRHLAPLCGRAVFSQPDGSSLVYVDSGDGVSSEFVLYNKDGKVRTWDFEREGKARNMLADPARQRAFVAIQSTTETKLYELDLSPGGSDVAKEFVKAPTNLVVPPVFEDGRLAVFAPNAITVYGADGTVNATFETLGQFRQAVGDARLQDNFLLGERPRLDRATLDMWLPVAARWLPFKDGAEIVNAPPVAGKAQRGEDRCMNFAVKVDGKTAMQAMHLPDETVYQRMVMGERSAAIEVDEQAREMHFGDDGPTVSVASKSMTWQFPGGEAESNSIMDIVSAMPVKAGNEHYVAMTERTGGQERAVVWYNLDKKSYELYDLGARVGGMYGGDADSVYAVGANGAVLMLEPPLEPGEHVETRVKLPKAPEERSSGQIVQGDETVIINGIAVQRRR